MSTVYKWSSKTLVGMVGTPCDRKNFDLFVNISKHIPEYEFVWIGGDSSYQERNLTVIAQTKDVLSYMYAMNCFLLTSKVDLCPVVLLEALALNVSSIIFQKNIGYKHKECSHLLSVNKDIENIKIQNFKKIIIEAMEKPFEKSNDFLTGNQYISDNFVYKKREFVKLLKNQANYTTEDKRKLNSSKLRPSDVFNEEEVYDSIFV